MSKSGGLEMRYFVLKPSGETKYHEASRDAMRAYADTIEQVNPELAKDLREWARRESNWKKGRLKGG